MPHATEHIVLERMASGKSIDGFDSGKKYYTISQPMKSFSEDAELTYLLGNIF